MPVMGKNFQPEEVKSPARTTQKVSISECVETNTEYDSKLQNRGVSVNDLPRYKEIKSLYKKQVTRVCTRM